VITEIRDLDIFQDSLLYVTTDKGIFVGNTRSNLKLSESWDLVYNDNDAKQYLPFDDGISNGGFVITDSLIFNNQTGNWLDIYDIFNQWPYCEEPDSEGHPVPCPSPHSDSYCETRNLGTCGPDVISASWHDQKVELLLDQLYVILNNDGSEDYSRTVPYSEWEGFQTKFTSFSISNDKRILGMQSYGLLSFDINSDSYQLFVPNTSHTNEFYALVVTSSGDLAAVSKTGVLMARENKKGRIVDSNGFVYHNALSYPDYKYFPKNHEQNNFQSVLLLYHVGKYSKHNINYSTYNIIEKNNGNLIYGNTGLWPKSSSLDTKYPSVIELDPLTYEFSPYDTMNQV
jgi:hypothetical protein